MTKVVVVVSFFDGIGCGRQTLKNLGVDVNEYHAFEIDPHAIKIAKKNHPDIIHHGDVENWFSCDIDWVNVDLIIAGSPCQGFSYAGKQLAFDDPRSALFFTWVKFVNFMRFVRGDDVKIFLENVKMKKEFLNVITTNMKHEPVFINSALVCAQNRQRYYWANRKLSVPADRHIYLKDILEDEWLSRPDKSQCIDANYHKGVDNHGQRTMIKWNPAAIVGRRINHVTGKRDDYNNNIVPVQYLEVHDHGKSRCLSTVSKDTLISSLPPGRYKASEHGIYYRKLTPIECERLQGLPDNYTEGVSNTQRYKMLGNGWQVDTIEHCFKELLR